MEVQSLTLATRCVASSTLSSLKIAPPPSSPFATSAGYTRIVVYLLLVVTYNIFLPHLIALLDHRSAVIRFSLYVKGLILSCSPHIGDFSTSTSKSSIPPYL